MNDFAFSARRRNLMKLVALPLVVGAAAWAQDKFPSRPIRITVPFPVGTTDYVGRLIGQKLGEQMGATVVVENKTGASGNIAADFVASAPADGYNLLLGAVSVVTNPALMARPPYVPAQLVPLGVGIDSQLVLVARTAFPARDLAALVKAAADKPGEVIAASPGVATLPHLGIEMLGTQAHVKFNHVPYRGSALVLTDLIAGRVDWVIDALVSARPFISSGKVRALAVLTPKRMASLPDVPTAGEQGFKFLEFSAWNGFMVAAGTSPALVQTLHEALARAIQAPEVSNPLIERGLDPVVLSPSAYLDFVLRESKRWSQVIKDAHVTV
jgi:tripartite-type tricarboxylate transporter receptor subunit TctC